MDIDDLREKIRDLHATRMKNASFEQKNAVDNALSLAMEGSKETSGAGYLDEKMEKFMRSVCTKTKKQKIGGQPKFCKYLDEYEAELTRT